MLGFLTMKGDTLNGMRLARVGSAAGFHQNGKADGTVTVVYYRDKEEISCILWYYDLGLRHYE